MSNQSLTQENYTQLCVWPGTCLNGTTVEDFEKFFLDELGTRVKYHTEVETLPDLDETGTPVPETGGRSDLFFYVHSADTAKFAVPRLKMGIRWWEDVVGYNDNSHLYSAEFLAAHPLAW
jgi:hypothetical protein